jgi:hypothetical protein
MVLLVTRGANQGDAPDSVPVLAPDCHGPDRLQALTDRQPQVRRFTGLHDRASSSHWSRWIRMKIVARHARRSRRVPSSDSKPVDQTAMTKRDPDLARLRGRLGGLTLAATRDPMEYTAKARLVK